MIIEECDGCAIEAPEDALRDGLCPKCSAAVAATVARLVQCIRCGDSFAATYETSLGLRYCRKCMKSTFRGEKQRE